MFESAKKKSDDNLSLFSSTRPRESADCETRLAGLIKTDQCVTSMTITLPMAETMMARNTANRPRKNREIKQLEKSMRAGVFVVTGQPIIFSKCGILLDGQNRLYACLAAGRMIKVDVRFGIEKEHFKWMDIGVKRTLADMLSVLGEKDTIALAVALTRLSRFNSGRQIAINRDNSIQPADAIETLMQFPGLPDSIQFSRKANKAISHIRIGLGTFIHYICSEKDPDLADQFFEYIATGIGDSSKGSPLRRLREEFIKTKRRMDDPEITAICFNTWNVLRKGSGRLVLQWNPGDEFPMVI